MTGLAFLLFTFYMVTDPPTTPSSGQGPGRVRGDGGGCPTVC